MRLDASIECGTDEHGSVTELAFGLIALWPAGSLILFTSLLVACYKPAAGRCSDEYKKNFTTKLPSTTKRNLLVGGG